MKRKEFINFDDVIPDDLKLKVRNVNKISIQHPSRAVIIGPTGSGKSNALLNMLLNPEYKITYDRIYYICRDLTEDKVKYLNTYFSDIQSKVMKKTNEKIEVFTLSDKLEDLPDLDKGLDKKKQNLIILDDLITIKKQKIVEDYFIRSRKQNCTCIYISQSYFRIPRTIRLNSEYFLIFSIPSRRELNNLYQEFGNQVEDQRTFNQIVRASTKGHNFFMVDNKTSIPLMKLRKNLDQGWMLPVYEDDDDENYVTKPTLITIVDK